MTSGYMKCPKCSKDFQYAGYQFLKWVEYPEPWKCQHCGSLIEVDHAKGYGLKVKEADNG